MASQDDVESGHDTGTVSAREPALPATGAEAQSVWVLSRKRADGEVESLRAFDEGARARADLELVQSVSEDEFWLAQVPLVQSRQAAPGERLSPVQHLALAWLADGAEAEGAAHLEETVQVRPQHVRGFLSVPPEEWRQMEERGWVRNGMLTPEGAAVIGRKRP